MVDWTSGTADASAGELATAFIPLRVPGTPDVFKETPVSNIALRDSALLGSERVAFNGGSSFAGTFRNSASAVPTVVIFNGAVSGDNSLTEFLTDGGTTRGSIKFNRGAGLVAYNTTSDYRAKDVRGPVEQEDVGERIDSLEIVMATMKGATIERPMVIAHQAQEAGFGFAVTGEKDATAMVDIRDEDGEVTGTEERDLMQGVDYSAFVPDLLAEVKFLRARVAALEALELGV